MDSAGDGGLSNRKGNDNSLGHGGYHHDSSNHHHHHHPRHQYFSGVALKITLLFVVVGIICLLLNQSAYPTGFFRRYYPSCYNHAATQQSASSSFHQFMTENIPSLAKEEIELEKTLRKAAMKDGKTVIITALNAAWTEPNSIFDLFLEGFRIGNGTQKLLKHLVVAAFDLKAYSRCMKERLHCYAVTTEGVNFSGEAHFMSEDYLKMMWRRIDFLRTVLELGFDFVFTDADIMWLRDPFERFYPDGEFQISSDRYFLSYNDLNNQPNGGFNYVKSNNRTIRFYNYWHTGKDYFPGKHDQNVLDLIKHNPYIKGIGVHIWFLDTAYFGGICEPSKDLDLVVTMHANCCIGLRRKIHDLRMVIDNWKRYMSFPSGVERNLSARSWTGPRLCPYTKIDNT